MLYSPYLRRGVVYVPTVVKADAGGYMEIEPIAVVPLTDANGLRRAFQAAVSRGNPTVRTPTRDEYPPPAILKYAGVKTWSAFARGTSPWSIVEQGGNYQIIGHRMHRAGYWEEDPEQKTNFPPGTTIEAVIERMIEILQDAVRQ
jgi:hypothetical protein